MSYSATIANIIKEDRLAPVMKQYEPLLNISLVIVIVNLGGATGTEVASLAAAVRTSVRQRFGIDLHPEVNIL